MLGLRRSEGAPLGLEQGVQAVHRLQHHNRRPPDEIESGLDQPWVTQHDVEAIGLLLREPGATRARLHRGGAERGNLELGAMLVGRDLRDLGLDVAHDIVRAGMLAVHQHPTTLLYLAGGVLGQPCVVRKDAVCREPIRRVALPFPLGRDGFGPPRRVWIQQRRLEIGRQRIIA